MKELILEVILTRRSATILFEQHKASLAAWTEANQGLITALGNARVGQDRAETALREAALGVYQQTGEKKPAPGVEVKLRTNLIYEEAAALVWASEHKIALALDKKAFEKVAKASPLPFVLVEQTPFATIATELGEHYGPKEAPTPERPSSNANITEEAPR